MRKYTLAPAAIQDIEEILRWTHDQFGESARRRYEALLSQAISDVAEALQLSGSIERPDIATTVRTYHLYFSRNRVATSLGRVKHPRHFLLYRMSENAHVEIGRVLHDSMDFDRHLPDPYRISKGD